MSFPKPRSDDPLVDRRDHLHDGPCPADAARPHFPANVTGLFETNDPSPEGRRRKGGDPFRASISSLETFDIAHGGDPSPSRLFDRPDYSGLDRQRKLPATGSSEVARTASGRAEQRTPDEVDGPNGPAPVLHGSFHDALDQLRRGRPPERSTRPVVHESSQGVAAIGYDRHERSDTPAPMEFALRAENSLRRAGQYGPHSRDAGFPFRKEPIGIAECAQEGTEVRSADPHVIEDENERPALAPKTAKEPRDDLGDRESSPVEPFIHAGEECRGDPVRRAVPGGSEGEPPRDLPRVRNPKAIGDFPGGPAGDARRSRPASSHDPHHPWRWSLRIRGVEPTDGFGYFGLPTEDHGGQPVVRENFGVRGGQHATLYY
jgi:hypothetical protein